MIDLAYMSEITDSRPNAFEQMDNFPKQSLY